MTLKRLLVALPCAIAAVLTVLIAAAVTSIRQSGSAMAQSAQPSAAKTEAHCVS